MSNKTIEFKIELAKKNNTKVVYNNTPESMVILELQEKIDKLFKFANRNSGIKIPMDTVLEGKKDFLFMTTSLEQYLEDFAAQIGYKNFKKSGSLKLMKKNIDMLGGDLNCK
jgi:hypothetical protein